MENEKIRTSRASQTRAKTVKKTVWTPQSSLDAPPAPDGYHHRWIRSETMGFDDTKNMAGKLRSGYELLMASEYNNSGYPIVEDCKHKGVIGVGGLLLARIPNEVAKARQKYYSEKAMERDEAVKNDLLKDQHPSMPISYDSRSSKSFGGK